ncbi:MAG: D-glycero-beta-D-manno-heptose 1-phosphate adenylyltransferase [Desulfobacterales bacterium]|nr:D-glycero-beta-D-manno-heptose 1-phosphate adenylyltransferase [Desulfobacterales bacterium]
MILDIEKIEERLTFLKKEGKRIVFTNGCFDIMHVGHVRYLESAKKEGDILIVGLNSDISVRTIKGIKRPIINQQQRAEVLSALSCVDYVVFFDEPDPFNIIDRLQPDVLVKGADWTEDKIIGADIVKKRGGKVARIKIVPDISTSEIIKRIIKRYSN